MFHYILTISMILLPVQSCPTTSGGVSWTEVGNNCYHVSEAKLTWYEAQEYCWSLGGYLAEILSSVEEALLDSYLPESGTYWLGLSDSGHEGRYQHFNVAVTDGQMLIQEFTDGRKAI